MTNKWKPTITDTGDGEPVTYTLWVADTGDVEHVRVDKDHNAYVVKHTVPKPRGRPTTTDWLGALRWLVVEVSKGGLPKGRGGQAAVEGWMAQWFSDRNFDVAMSQIQEQVKQIYDQVDDKP